MLPIRPSFGKNENLPRKIFQPKPWMNFIKTFVIFQDFRPKNSGKKLTL
jgi:hypothetical protein